MNSLLDDTLYYKLYDAMSTGYVSGGEYLPYGTNADILFYNDPIVGENIELNHFIKGDLSANFEYKNFSQEDSYIDVPLLNYKGYQAINVDTNETYEITDGSNNVVRVILPANSVGSIKVIFVVPWYWRLAEAVSLLTLLGCIIVALRRSRNLKLESIEEHDTIEALEK